MDRNCGVLLNAADLPRSQSTDFCKGKSYLEEFTIREGVRQG